MQRRYRTKKYYCGEYLEVAIYPVYIHPKKRGKRSNPTTEIQQRLNQRHAEGKLRRLLHTNFTDADLFATLTFDDANLPAAPEDAQKLIQNFLRRLKRKYARLGLGAKYIYVLEYGKKHNRLHFHLVLTRGIDCSLKRARQMTRADYGSFDYIICMDSYNLRNMERIAADTDKKYRRLLDYTDSPHDVADPWYTGDFATTEKEVQLGCEALLRKIIKQ